MTGQKLMMINVALLTQIVKFKIIMIKSSLCKRQQLLEQQTDKMKRL